ncbi:hypothetical protein [Mycobacterium novum]
MTAKAFYTQIGSDVFDSSPLTAGPWTPLVKDGQAISYARGKSREAMLTVSANIRGYRDARTVNPDAIMPEFTMAQRAELADDDGPES